MRLISEVLKKMGISSKSLTLEEKEDFGLGLAMKEADRTKRVSANLIIQKLKS